KYLLFASLLFASCQKDDLPVTLPQKGEVEYSLVEMGEDYTDQLFFNFETNSVVHVSQVNSWDLAFDAGVGGFHMYMNGGADVLVYNTHETDFTKVTTAPGVLSEEWLFDRPCGLGDSTGIGDWRGKTATGSEIFIVKLNSTYITNNLKKVRIVLVDGSKYVLEYADLDENITHTITIPKDDKYNYVYFSFDKGGQAVQPDPPKDTWDIVFTRYRFIYYDLDNFKYIVSGVLTNPYNTTSAADSTDKFADITGSKVTELTYSDHRDIIGFDWKEYNFDTKSYDMHPEKNYVIKNRNGNYWKIHFLDFYNKQGVKGCPSFEFQRAY
ncbi:MAG: HmuY family protein, partial [Chitinophagaceae bacterium]|nr:HmuY family protein [Chitinophagaceae bacterium]